MFQAPPQLITILPQSLPRFVNPREYLSSATEPSLLRVLSGDEKQQ